MRVINTCEDMAREARQNLQRGIEVGFVPTMGALHEGHASLIRRAVDENELAAVSIFVNPTQFMPGEDFSTYPRTMEADLAMCEEEGVQLVFTPPASEMYPPNYQTSVQPGPLADHLCGLSRGRGHFAGVCTVVAKLFNLVRPDRVYFGQKDAQQALIVQRMVIDLNFPLEVIVCPIVREADGLAMSSRNRRLPPGYRPAALALRRALSFGGELVRRGETSSLKLLEEMFKILAATPEVEVDYLNICSPQTLADVDDIGEMALIAGAVKVGEVRLIDNLLVGPDGPWES